VVICSEVTWSYYSCVCRVDCWVSPVQTRDWLLCVSLREGTWQSVTWDGSPAKRCSPTSPWVRKARGDMSSWMKCCKKKKKLLILFLIKQSFHRAEHKKTNKWQACSVKVVFEVNIQVTAALCLKSALCVITPFPRGWPLTCRASAGEYQQEVGPMTCSPNLVNLMAVILPVMQEIIIKTTELMQKTQRATIAELDN